MSHFSYQRPHLAVAYCDSLAGEGIANARSGLFLAGPRRVGKSTFLLEELMPEIEKRGWIAIYVDLWANKNADPLSLLIESLKAKMLEHEGKMTKLAKAVKVTKLKVMGTFVIDFTKPGFPENMTLADGLRLLHEMTGKPLVLMIDEAQHALNTDTGMNAMFAVKSARDQLNTLNKTILMLVLTGSNRDKLSHLVLKKNQPFFGSEVTAFPLLNQDFTQAFTQWANKNLAPDNQFTAESMWRAFKIIGHRPEILSQLAGRIAISGEAQNFGELLEKDALIWHTRIWDEFENDFNALNALQQAILSTLISYGRSWSPFAEDSIRHYQALTGQTNISITAIQAAIQTLRERDLIWQSGRGEYALEDEGFAEWYKRREQH